MICFYLAEPVGICFMKLPKFFLLVLYLLTIDITSKSWAGESAAVEIAARPKAFSSLFNMSDHERVYLAEMQSIKDRYQNPNAHIPELAGICEDYYRRHSGGLGEEQLGLLGQFRANLQQHLDNQSLTMNVMAYHMLQLSILMNPNISDRYERDIVFAGINFMIASRVWTKSYDEAYQIALDLDKNEEDKNEEDELVKQIVTDIFQLSNRGFWVFPYTNAKNKPFFSFDLYLQAFAKGITLIGIGRDNVHNDMIPGEFPYLVTYHDVLHIQSFCTKAAPKASDSEAIRQNAQQARAMAGAINYGLSCGRDPINMTRLFLVAHELTRYQSASELDLQASEAAVVLQAMIDHSKGYAGTLFVSDVSMEAYYRRMLAEIGHGVPADYDFLGEPLNLEALPALRNETTRPVAVFAKLVVTETDATDTTVSNYFHSRSVGFSDTYDHRPRFSHSIAEILRYSGYKSTETAAALSPYNPSEAGRLMQEFLSLPVHKP